MKLSSVITYRDYQIQIGLNAELKKYWWFVFSKGELLIKSHRGYETERESEYEAKYEIDCEAHFAQIPQSGK